MIRGARRAIVLSACALLILHGGAAAAATPEEPQPTAAVADEVQQAVEQGPVEVLVAYDGAASQQRLDAAQTQSLDVRVRAQEGAKADLGRLKSAALRGSGAQVTVTRDFDALPVQLVRVESPQALAELASQPGVLSVEPDQKLEMMAEAAGPYEPATVDTGWTRLIRQPEAAAAGYDGRGTRVAVIDAGVNTTTPAAIAAFGDCSAGWGQRNCRIDRFTDVVGAGLQEFNSHGTNVAGVVTAVAPATQLDVYQVFHREWGASGPVDVTNTSDVLTALNQVAGGAVTRKVKAVNLSLGIPKAWSTTTCVSAWSQGIAQVRAAGVTPVVASGNSAHYEGTFNNGVSDPACAGGAFSVGATYTSTSGPRSYGGYSLCSDPMPRTDSLACFSQTGPILGMLAPGVDISAAGVSKTGTSQAAPMVAGAVAAISSAARQASPDQLIAALSQHGPAVSDPRNGVTSRRLDVYAAATSLAPSPNALSSAGSRLTPGSSLSEQQRLVSPNGQHRLGVGVLGMQEALGVTSDSCDAQPFTWLMAEADNRLVMQEDGNLVLYGNGVRWASSTFGNPGAFAVMQDDRNFVIYSAAGRPLWMTGGACSVSSAYDPHRRVLTNSTLTPGQYMLSPDRSTRLVMQSDGNLVMYRAGRPTWSSNTFGNAGAFFRYQGDGNLVVYSAAGRPLWVSGTATSFTVWPTMTTRLVLQNDGNLVLYRSNNVPAWHTNTGGR